ncbi:MAG: hypothetical protein ACR2NP_22790 [Pirellulaceae bacterium]
MSGEKVELAQRGPLEKRAGLLVLGFGLLTTAVTLFVISLFSSPAFRPLNIYVFVIFPLGALIVGVIAGSGYGLGSWWTGAKIGGKLLVLILLWQAMAYFAVQFVEYMAVRPGLIPPRSFGEYFDVTTRNFKLENGPRLGVWGYGLRFLQLAGFAAGGVLGSLLLLAQPYCDRCQVYRKNKQLGLVPAGVKPRKVNKNDAEAQTTLQADVDEAFNGGLQLMEETAAMAEAGDTSSFCELMQEFKAQKKEIGKQSTRLSVSVEYCPACHEGQLIYKTVQGHGDETIVQELAEWSVGPAFVREVLISL